MSALNVPVPNGTLNPRGLPRSPHFCDVMPLWLSGSVGSVEVRIEGVHNGRKGGAQEHPSERQNE